jgi:heat shock protein HslJ
MSSALRLVRFTAAPIAVLALVACSSTVAGPSKVTSSPIASLAIEPNVVWHLESIVSADGSRLTIGDPNLFTLMLTLDGKASARADCNRASGRLASSDTLSIDRSRRQAYCASAPVDQQFLMLLGGENSA